MLDHAPYKVRVMLGGKRKGRMTITGPGYRKGLCAADGGTMEGTEDTVAALMNGRLTKAADEAVCIPTGAKP